MKTTILSLFCVLALSHAPAADVPLLPTALNNLLPKIRAGMSIKAVETVLATAYPEVTSATGEWSGQAGYIDYKLDSQHQLSVASVTTKGEQVVDDEILLKIVNNQTKKRIDLRISKAAQ